MPKKAHQKKKEHQAFCREQVRKGMINNEKGEWIGSAHVVPKNMARDMFNGYKFNRR